MASVGIFLWILGVGLAPLLAWIWITRIAENRKMDRMDPEERRAYLEKPYEE